VWEFKNRFVEHLVPDVKILNGYITGLEECRYRAISITQVFSSVLGINLLQLLIFRLHMVERIPYFLLSCIYVYSQTRSVAFIHTIIPVNGSLHYCYPLLSLSAYTCCILNDYYRRFHTWSTHCICTFYLCF